MGKRYEPTNSYSSFLCSCLPTDSKKYWQKNYGTATIGDNIEHFWLDGSLKISAIQQTVFLADLVNLSLEYPKGIQKKVQEIILLERCTNWQLYGKTAWATNENPPIEWFVG